MNVNNVTSEELKNIMTRGLTGLFKDILPYVTRNDMTFRKCHKFLIVKFGIIKIDCQSISETYKIIFRYFPDYTIQWDYHTICDIVETNRDALERLSKIIVETDENYAKCLIQRRP